MSNINMSDSRCNLIKQLLCYSFSVCFATNCLAQISQKNDVDNTYQIYNNLNVDRPSINIKQSIWFRFYKNNISSQLSSQCQFTNTCSEFMSVAVNHQPILGGFLLGIDRLVRCGSSNYAFYQLPSLINYNNQTINDDFIFYESDK